MKEKNSIYETPSMTCIDLEKIDVITMSNAGQEGSGSGVVDGTIWEEGSW